MNISWNLIGLLAINLIFALASDTFGKIWAVNHQMRWFYLAFILGIGAIITFMLVVRSGGLSVGSTVALILTVLGNIFIGLYFFKESLAPLQWLGVTLGIIAVLLILRPFGN